MGTFSIEIDIGRPPPDVFAVLSDVAAMPRWYEAVKQVTTLTPAITGAGARYTIGRTLPGGPVTNELEVTEHIPDRVFTITSLTGPTPFQYRYTLTPSPNATRLQLDGRISGDGLPGLVARIDFLVTRLFKRGMRTNLEKLRQLIESP